MRHDTGISIDAVYRRACGPGIKPYPYQSALAKDPDAAVLIAPTGVGKTAAVTLGWAWRRLTRPAETPRRLVWCLPMRTLVEQVARDAAKWMGGLDETFKNEGQDCPKIHMVMGGVEPGPDRWQLHPEHAAIIIGTQDMLLSRALMRGYGMSRFGWPIDFGLLHTDALWVFDEVQLMGAGFATSTQMEGFRQREGWRTKRIAQSLWVSATLDPKWLATVDFRREIGLPRTLRWDDGGAPEPPGLRARLDARKAIRKADIELTTAHTKKPEAYATALAAEVLQAHRDGCTTLVILNTVRRAQALYRALERAGRRGDGLLLLHSRFRPHERQFLEERLRNEAATDRIVVATQAVEAGVDMTSAVFFTELAPWSSLVQRFGRCNREGELNDKGGAEIRWVDMALDETGQAAAPYEADALQAAREIVAKLAHAAPRNLPPAAEPPQAKQVVRAKDFEEGRDPRFEPAILSP